MIDAAARLRGYHENVGRGQSSGWGSALIQVGGTAELTTLEPGVTMG